MLAEFVMGTLGEPFDRGRNNCAFWAADAVLHCTGIDPAAEFRSACVDWNSCRNLLIQRGGLRRLACDMMNPLGFDDLAEEGVAVARADGQVLCGIVLEGRFVAKATRGGRFHDDAEILEGWSWRRP